MLERCSYSNTKMEISASKKPPNCLNIFEQSVSINDILLESLPSAIVLIDESGKILFCNNAFKKLIHHQDAIGLELSTLISVDAFLSLPQMERVEGEMKQNSSHFLLPTSDGWAGTESEWLKENLTTAFDTGQASQARNLAYSLLNGDGALHAVRSEAPQEDRRRILSERQIGFSDIRIQPLGDVQSDGKKMALVIIDDTTEDVMLERRLIRAEKLASVGRLSANLAHELNSPLDGAIRYANFLLEDIHEEDPRRKYVLRIIDGLDRMSEIVQGILCFSRQNPQSLKPTNIHQSIENTLSFFDDPIGFHQITVETKFDNQIPTVLYADIKYVFLNLIKNAIQAMPDGGKLRIETKLIKSPSAKIQEISDWIEIKVIDTGCGIPPELQDSIFAPFFTTKDVREGTGLGLSICQGIVSRYNGELDIKSKLQRGTAVKVRLPMTDVS